MRLLTTSQLIHSFKLSQDLLVDRVRRSKFSATTEPILGMQRPKSTLLWSILWNLDQIDNCLRRRDPPHASHAGGVWERMIRSIRKILRSLLGSQIVDDETLLTRMAEVEKILNDRPLTLPRQVIRTILSLSLQVNYSSCGQTYVFLLENQTLSTSIEVNAGNKPSIWRTYSGNDGYLSTCRRFKPSRNRSARVQI